MAKTNYSTYLAIKSQLLDIFKQEEFERNKLPSEPILAKRLGISLVTLREALLMLAMEGYITKRHGSGNYVHPSALYFEKNNICFTDCIEKEGFRSGIDLFRQETHPADAKAADMLRINEGDMLMCSHAVYTADDAPAIYCIGCIPVELLQEEETPSAPDQPYVNRMIWNCCHRDLAHALNEYFPTLLDEETAKILGMKAGEPVIGCRQVFYDVFDTPVMYTLHYFNPRYYKLRALENWDLNQPN